MYILYQKFLSNIGPLQFILQLFYNKLVLQKRLKAFCHSLYWLTFSRYWDLFFWSSYRCPDWLTSDRHIVVLIGRLQLAGADVVPFPLAFLALRGPRASRVTARWCMVPPSFAVSDFRTERKSPRVKRFQRSILRRDPGLLQDVPGASVYTPRRL